MTTYTDSLYEQIIGRLSSKSSRLQVISGYASAAFLKRVLQQFPHLHIDLYIGMTHQGISRQDHDMYCELTKKKTGVHVYYQITPVPNHMKILRFENDNEINTFVGSANFSENGFLYQREIMTEITESLQLVFDEQYQNSLLCTEDTISSFISFFQSSYEARIEIEDQQRIETKEIEAQQIAEREDLELYEVAAYQKRYIELYEATQQNSGILSLKEFSIELVLPQKQDKHWADTGINAWRQNKEPHLKQTPKLMFDKVFPLGRMFDIYTDDGIKIQANVTGKFNSRQICAKNVNLYKYVCKRIGLNNGAPISYENLVSYGRTNMLFRRINETTYIMNFQREQ